MWEGAFLMPLIYFLNHHHRLHLVHVQPLPLRLASVTQNTMNSSMESIEYHIGEPELKMDGFPIQLT